jgi:DedD protein
MLSARRPAPPRHEYRFGPQELVTCGAAFLLIWALTFVFGLLVGREFAGGARGRAGDANPKPALAATAPDAERQPPGTPARKPERGGSEDHLTFYKTLTAPTVDLPATTASAPKIEERMVPQEAAPAPASPAVELHPSPPHAPAPAVKSLPASPRKPIREPAVAPAPERRPSPGPAAGPGPDPAAARPWTVQVSSFRSRALADELRVQLAAKGFDAYTVSVTTEEGQVRHRVRVGGFSTRAEAERVAAELRGERNLNPFVTTRSRN